MPITHLAVIAIVQGITEFLPISSSGHLVLVPVLMGWSDHGLAIDIAAHSGSLCAVLLYFRTDIAALGRGLLSLGQGKGGRDSRFFGYLLLASCPTILVGAGLVAIEPNFFRNVETIAWATLIGAAVLYVTDQLASKRGSLLQMKMSHASVIGVFQILALIPGASRAGVTITAGRLCGYSRTEAARFSMLTAIPVLIAACSYNFLVLLQNGQSGLIAPALATAGLAFLSSLGAIALMMRWIRQASFTPLIIYRLILGFSLLAWTYGIQ
jgi:undecaprenyl-diphosphatase